MPFTTRRSPGEAGLKNEITCFGRHWVEYDLFLGLDKCAWSSEHILIEDRVLGWTVCWSMGFVENQDFINPWKSVLNIHWKDWCWNANTLATWWEEQLIGKDPDAGKDRRQEEKGMAEGEMVGWHHLLNGQEFEQAREMVKDQEAWHASMGLQRVWHDWVTEQYGDDIST